MVELNGLLSSTTGGAVNTIGTNLFGASGGVSGGNRAYLRGLPLMLRSSRYATVHNKVGRAILAMPRQKFLFYATFNAGTKLQRHPDFSSWQQGFAFQISKIDRPKTTPQLKTMNQYNRKRIVHTGIEHGDMSITLHDTVDDRILRVWRDYYQWYFGDGRPKKDADSWKTSVIQKREDFSVGNGWGFSPPATTGWDTNFFDSLDIYTFYGKKYTKLTIYNPKIAAINWEGMDTESSALLTVEMTIQYEGFAYTAVAQPLDATLINKFNLNGGDYYEPEDLFGGVNAFLLDLNDSFESALDGILGTARNIPFVGQVLSGLGSNAVRASGVGGFVPRVTQALASTSLGRWGNFR